MLVFITILLISHTINADNNDNYFMGLQKQIKNSCEDNNEITGCNNTNNILHNINNELVVDFFYILFFLLFCIFFRHLIKKKIITITYSKIIDFTQKSLKKNLLKNLLILFFLIVYFIMYLYLHNLLIYITPDVSIPEYYTTNNTKGLVEMPIEFNNYNNFLSKHTNLFFNVFYWQPLGGWFYTLEIINLSFLHDIY